MHFRFKFWQLKEEALNPNKFNKKSKDAFFKIVKEKNQLVFIEKLAELKYAPAKKYLQTLKKREPQSRKKKKVAKILEYASTGNIKKIKKIILDNADLDFQNENGNSALAVSSCISTW